MAIMLTPIMKLKNTANFSVFKTSYISLFLLYSSYRMFDHCRLLPFVVGLSVGGVLYFVYKPEKKVISQYPHPNDADNKIFKDPNGTCYKYRVHDVNCDANEATLKDYPIQS
jgi:hypothetical protein